MATDPESRAEEHGAAVAGPPRRVLFVECSTELGGAQRSLAEIAAALAPRFEIHAALPGPGPLADRLKAAGASVAFLPLFRLKRVRGTKFFRQAFDWLRGVRALTALLRDLRPDIVHANGYQAQAFAGLAGRFARIPVIWHHRDLAPSGRMGRYLASRATRIFCVSGAVLQHAQALGARPDSAVLIPNGLDSTAYHPEMHRERVRQELGIAPGDFLAGCAGRLVPWKRCDLFLRATARASREIPGARFLIIGGDLTGEHPGLEAELHALAASLGLGDRALFLGQREDLPELLDALDVLVHPAPDEPFGRVLLEAMALGKPVIAARAAGPAEIVVDGKTGLLVSPGATEELARAMIALAADPARARAMGSAGRRRLESAYTLEACAARVAGLYADLAARPQS